MIKVFEFIADSIRLKNCVSRGPIREKSAAFTALRIYLVSV